LQCIEGDEMSATSDERNMCVAVCCSVLQRVAVCCSTHQALRKCVKRDEIGAT